MAQLWVNLPAKDKMTQPGYQAIENSQMGKYQLPDQKGVVEVIAGQYKDVKGPAHTFTPIHMYVCRLSAGANLTLDLPAHYNSGILTVEGKALVNGHQAPTDHFTLLKNDGNEVAIETLEATVLLVLSGEPINEPIVPYGPFLMNTKEEIVQAMIENYQMKIEILERVLERLPDENTGKSKKENSNTS